MLPGNDDNCDEVSKKAAEDYRLNSADPDWQALAQKMQQFTESSQDASAHRAPWLKKIAARLPRLFKKKMGRGGLLAPSIKLLVNPMLISH